MSERVEFVFGLGSRYSYLAATQLDGETCIEIAGSISLDAQKFKSMLADASLRARVQADAERCAARGAFGVPTFFAGDRMFWGNDRLVLLEDWLKRRP